MLTPLGLAPKPTPTAATGTWDRCLPQPQPLDYPLAMRANVEHNQIFHQHVVILSIETSPVPHVAPADRLAIDELAGDTGKIRIWAATQPPN